MTDSNQKKRSRKSKTKKPKKPYSEFPLGSTTNGFWQKRIDGKIYYFGRWGQVINGKMVRLPEDGWKEVLALYKAQIDDLKAGCEPQSVNSKELIVARTFAEYKLSYQTYHPFQLSTLLEKKPEENIKVIPLLRKPSKNAIKKTTVVP